MNNFISKEEYEKELLKRIHALKTAWDDMVEMCNSIVDDKIYFNVDINDYIVENYPFDMSFDEIDISSWVESIEDKIKTSEN